MNAFYALPARFFFFYFARKRDSLFLILREAAREEKKRDKKVSRTVAYRRYVWYVLFSLSLSLSLSLFLEERGEGAKKKKKEAARTFSRMLVFHQRKRDVKVNGERQKGKKMGLDRYERASNDRHSTHVHVHW